MICRVCGEEFIPKPKHPGYINVCLEPECRAEAQKPVVVISFRLKERDGLVGAPNAGTTVKSS